MVGVAVATEGVYKGGDVQTDNAGRFRLSVRLPSDRWPSLVRFWSEGYQPTTKILKELPSDLVVTLEKTNEQPWTISKCSSKPEFGNAESMAFFLPAGTNVRRGQDIDYWIQSIEFNKHWLEFGTGPLWSLGLPPSGQLKDLTNIRERNVVFNDYGIGAEYRGLRPDGTHYRYVGKLLATISYDNASKEAADFFDKIIDTLCKP
jgi:hypothetical protein